MKKKKTAPSAPAASTRPETPVIPTVARKKKKLYRPAVAFLGFVVIVLAVIGTISVVALGIKSYQTRQAALKKELTYFISPLTYYTPEAFDSPDDTEQDALILSALFRITEQERIRLLRNKDADYNYEIDDYSRLILPIKEVEKSYAVLYGDKAKPSFRTIGETDIPFACYEYNEEKQVYYAPMDSSESLYNVIVDRVKKSGDRYILDVCYVPDSNLKIDEQGNPLDPTRKEAQYIQKFTLQRKENRFTILSVEDEESSVSKVTSSSTSLTSATSTRYTVSVTSAQATAKTTAKSAAAQTTKK